MKKIIMQEQQEKILFRKIDSYKPIFAKKNNLLCGMIVKEEKGWILRLGGNSGATGYYNTLIECMEYCIKLGYEFYVN